MKRRIRIDFAGWRAWSARAFTEAYNAFAKRAASLQTTLTQTLRDTVSWFHETRRALSSTALERKARLLAAFKRRRARIKAYLRYRIALAWRRGRVVFLLVLFMGASVTGTWILYRTWSSIDAYLLDGPKTDLVRQLAVAIGTAITGLVAIVFSVTLFTVQHAADRGTAAMLEEYARDRRMWAIYSFLALFAFLSLLASMLPLPKHFITTVVVTEFLVVIATFLLLVLHFLRAIKLVNARDIVATQHRRGLKQLRQIKRDETMLIEAGIIRPPNEAQRDGN